MSQKISQESSQDLLTLLHPQVPNAFAEYSRDPLGFMTRCARELGEVVPLQFEEEMYCLLTNPDHITEVLKDRLRFIKARETRRLRGLLGNGLITNEGDFWQRQRRLSQPIFHQQRISGYGAVMVDYTQRMLQTWQVGQVLDVHEAMMRLTLNIVMKTIFDRDVSDSEANHVAHALDEVMNWYMTEEENADEIHRENWLDRTVKAIHQTLQSVGISIGESDRDYQKAIAQLDQTLYAMIQQRRDNQETGEDLLSMLMQVEDADDGSRMSDQQLRDEIATMILAGHETTANTLSWTWMLLDQHPQVRIQLQTELDQVLQGRMVTVADLPQLPYANWIIKEAMRLYPPVTDLSREAIEDCEVGGYRIAKGTTLVMSQWVMHRHERYFAEPEKFDPERWADDFENQLPRGVYFPFGDGPRICIGKSFALMEAVLILVTIAQQFELRLVPDQLIELQPSISLRPRHGIQVQLEAA
ncbi:cytochrome P450 [Phormidium tenue FACHB-886]|nr:cytochrome P450 [Phormidium tenue FACHB-886]